MRSLLTIGHVVANRILADMWLLLLILLGLAVAGCWRFYPRSENSEVILFSAIGNVPFQDSIYRIRSDGARLKDFLTPTPNRSYLYASGNSLRDKLVVTVHETNFAGEIADYLYIYHPSTDDWRRLVVEEGFEGVGIISPAGSKVVFTLAPPELRGQPKLWLTDLQKSETRQLTNPSYGTWEGSPAWSADGEQIAFLRSRFTPEGVLSNLLHVSSSGGEPTSLLGSEEPVGAFCYSPDGRRLAILTSAGLEILEISDKRRTVVLPWSKMSNHLYSGGGLAWSRSQDKIALALSNKQTNQHELWTTSSDGSNFRRIYTHKDARIFICAFMQE